MTRRFGDWVHTHTHKLEQMSWKTPFPSVLRLLPKTLSILENYIWSLNKKLQIATYINMHAYQCCPCPSEARPSPPGLGFRVEGL